MAFYGVLWVTPPCQGPVPSIRMSLPVPRQRLRDKSKATQSFLFWSFMDARPTLCVIYNPRAGRRRSGRLWLEMRRRLAHQADFWPTTAAGEGIALARKACDLGYSTLVAAGGDGTFHEVANGILTSTKPATAMGLIPLGSGNDYARTLRLPRDADTLVHWVCSSKAWCVDVGEATLPGQTGPRYFINTLGLGLSGAVSWEARQIHGLRGLPLYGLAAIKAIWRSFHALDTQFVVDDQPWSTATLFLSVAVGPTEGGGFVVAPEAKLDDGWLDYLHASSMSRWAALNHLPRLALGWLPENGGPIRRGRCRTMLIQSQQPMTIHTDGELIATPRQPAHEVAIRLLDRRLRLRCDPIR